MIDQSTRWEQADGILGGSSRPICILSDGARAESLGPRESDMATAVVELPTLGEWGFLLLCLILVTGGWWYSKSSGRREGTDA